MSENHHESDNTQTHVVLTNGTMVSHYRIIEKIGAGGMGEVYLAKDTELDRKVALKFLPHQLCQDEDCRARFKREAQAAAKLSHPNIIHIYEVSEYGGHPFFAMEHVEGRSLKEFSSDKDLSIEQILALAVEICEGLHAAHEKGVIHRDIKASNILIDSHGRAKIADFGLALVAGKDHLTRTGSTLGTIGYMSPEQVQGRDIDHRSDLFSLGVVLYELITRHNPFKHDSEAATLKAVCDDNPEPLARFKSGLPDGLQSIMEKALEKDVKTRYQHADGMLSDLARVRRLLESGPVPMDSRKRSTLPRRRRFLRILIPTSTLTIILVLILILKPWRIDIRTTEEAVASENRLAIMYFDNLAVPDDSLRLGEIVTNLLITDLSESRYVNVISSQRLYDILKQLGKEGQKQIDREVASQVAQKARARWMLMGSILGVAPRIVITTWLVDVESGDVGATQQITGDSEEDIFAIVDRLTVEIKNDLSLPGIAFQEPDPQIASVTTHSQEAYRHYLEGLDHYYQLYAFRAKNSFRKALELDTTFAMAYLRLALSDFFGHRAVLSVTNRKSIVKAVEYSGGANRKERMYIECLRRIARGDYEHAVVELNLVARQFPDEKEAFLFSGYIQLFRLNQPHRAIEAFRKSLEIDPLYKLAFNYLSYAYGTLGDFEKAMEANDRYISLVPNETNPYDSRGDLFAFHGDLDSAIAAYAKSAELDTLDDRRSLSKLANMHLLRSEYHTADSLYLRMTTSSEIDVRSSGRLCLAHSWAYRGKLDRALQLLDEGIAADLSEQADPVAVALKYLSKACLYEQKGQMDDAVLETEKALDCRDSIYLDPRIVIAPLLYIRLLAASGNSEEAGAYLKAWWDTTRDNPQADSTWYWYASGCIAFYEGDLGTSIRYLRKAANSTLRIPDGSFTYDLTHLMLAKAFLESDMYEAAIDEYENLLSNYTWGHAEFTSGATYFPIWGVKIPYYLGQAYEQTGQNDNAIKQYEAFLKTWKDADRGLKSVDDAQTRLAVLKRSI